MSAPVEPPRESIRWPQPGELWSLWDMLFQVSLREWLGVAERMEEFRRYWGAIDTEQLPPASDVERETLRRLIERVQGLAEKLDLPYSVQTAFDKARINVPKTHDELHNLFCLFKDETKSRKSLILSPSASRLYEMREPFGPDVFAKFNDAARDLEEATKCLALERNTAAVFHLMLAMERALRLMAVRMGADPFNTKGAWEKWSVIVGRMKAAIPNQPLVEQEAWTDAHNLLWSVGAAWRNKTMHPADVYTDAEANELYAAVRIFLQRLAPLMP